MKNRKRLGLKIIFWIANVLLSGTLTAEEQDDLKHLRTSLGVKEFEED